MALEERTEAALSNDADRQSFDLDAFAAQVAEACRRFPVATSHRLAPRVRPRWLARLTRRAPRAEFSEAFRLLGLQLRRMAAVTPMKTILVMSAYRGDGRTTVAANLSLALAEGGSRIVLVDGDLRRPGLATVLGLQEPAGAPAYGGAGHNGRHNGVHAEPAVVRATGVPGLALVQLASTAGAPLEPAQLAPLLAALRSVADYVIMDSPPCLQYADAFFLAPASHGVLYVVRRRQQDVEAQRRVHGQLGDLGARVLAVVLNEA